MFVLKTTVMILFFNAATPVPYGDAVTFPFSSRSQCEAQAMIYGQRVADLVAKELKRSEAPATVDRFDTACEPIGMSA